MEGASPVMSHSLEVEAADGDEGVESVDRRWSLGSTVADQLVDHQDLLEETSERVPVESSWAPLALTPGSKATTLRQHSPGASPDCGGRAALHM
ncbi:hypothetical protein U1Q18_016654 [Sarracenia purpurea var. burkii]